MRKSIALFLLLSFVTVMAQEKKILFTKQLRYELIGHDIPPIFESKILANSQGENLIQGKIMEFPFTIFANAGHSLPVNINLGNRLEYSPISQRIFGTDRIPEIPESTTFKKKETKTLQGKSCTNYEVTVNSDSTERLTMCIDEKNSINTVPAFFGALSFVGLGTARPAGEPKGLVLTLTLEDESDPLTLNLISSTDVNEFIYLDVSHEAAKRQKQQDSLRAYHNIYESDIDNAATAVDTAYANVDSAYSAIEAEDVYLHLPRYETGDRRPRIHEGSYAVDDVPSENAWAVLPKYCRNIPAVLPKLDDKTLLPHLSNYATQICDMYLAQADSHNVDVKGTMDEIRREDIFLFQRKDKMSKEDAMKIEKFLNKLD